MNTRALLLFEHEDRRATLRWCLAAAIVLAAHGGLAASYLLRSASPERGPQAPIVIVELAPLPVAPASNFDIAPGPTMQQSFAQPEPKPQEQAEKIETVPSADNSVVAAPATKSEPERETKPPAPRTSAPPRSPTHTGAVAAAPTAGQASANSFPPSWISQLFSHLLRYRQYPSSAQAARQEGTVTVNFTMDRNGRVLARYIVRGSGVAALDAEALAMIERAQPLPPFPREMAAATRSFTAPIKFTLR